MARIKFDWGTYYEDGAPCADQERAAREYEEQRKSDEEVARRNAEEARRERPFRIFGGFLAGIVGVPFTVAFIVLFFWALISGIRWLWDHPLW